MRSSAAAPRSASASSSAAFLAKRLLLNSFMRNTCLIPGVRFAFGVTTMRSAFSCGSAWTYSRPDGAMNTVQIGVITGPRYAPMSRLGIALRSTTRGSRWLRERQRLDETRRTPSSLTLGGAAPVRPMGEAAFPPAPPSRSWRNASRPPTATVMMRRIALRLSACCATRSLIVAPPRQAATISPCFPLG
jgi:hypothetical protein